LTIEVFASGTVKVTPGIKQPGGPVQLRSPILYLGTWFEIGATCIDKEDPAYKEVEDQKKKRRRRKKRKRKRRRN